MNKRIVCSMLGALYVAVAFWAFGIDVSQRGVNMGWLFIVSTYVGGIIYFCPSWKD